MGHPALEIEAIIAFDESNEITFKVASNYNQPA
jgi:hypothetical protein